MDFKEFLIKYTTISKKFIEDFHNIIKEDYFEKCREIEENGGIGIKK